MLGDARCINDNFAELYFMLICNMPKAVTFTAQAYQMPVKKKNETKRKVFAKKKENDAKSPLSLYRIAKCKDAFCNTSLDMEGMP